MTAISAAERTQRLVDRPLYRLERRRVCPFGNGHTDVQIAIRHMTEDKAAALRHALGDASAHRTDIPGHLRDRHTDIEMVCGSVSLDLKHILARAPHRPALRIRFRHDRIHDELGIQCLGERALEAIGVRAWIGTLCFEQYVQSKPVRQQR